MEEFNLQSFLAEAETEGRKDSEGQFRVSHEHAQKKLGRYSLPYPEAWVLKVVQAAVLWDAESISVKQSSTTTTIDFCPQKISELPLEDDIVHALLGEGLGGGGRLACLCLAMRSLVESSDFSFLLTINDGRTPLKPIYAGHDYDMLGHKGRVKLCQTDKLGFRIHVSHIRNGEFHKGRFLPGLFLGERRDIDIALEFEKNAFVSPIPITLDGRLITRILEHPKYGFSPFTRPLLLAGFPCTEGEKPLKLGCDGEQKAMSYYTDPRRANRSYQGDDQFSSWLLLRSLEVRERFRARERTHDILWIRNGVLSYREGITLRTELLSLTIFVNADELPTDLTGFGLLETEEREMRLKTSLQNLAHILEDCAINLDHFFTPDRDEHSEQDDRIALQRESQKRVPKLNLARLGELGKQLRSLVRPKAKELFSAEKEREWRRALDSDLQALVKVLELPRQEIVRPPELSKWRRQE